MQRGALPLGHRDDHPRQGRGRERPVDEQHRVDGAGVLGHFLHAGVGLAPRGRLARRRRVAFDARRDGGGHGKLLVGFCRNRDVVHVRRGPHDRRVAGRQIHLSADTIVIGVEAVLGHRRDAARDAQRLRSSDDSAGAGHGRPGRRAAPTCSARDAAPSGRRRESGRTAGDQMKG